MKKISDTEYAVETGGGYIFNTAEKAENWETNLKNFWAIMETVPQELTADQYHELCSKLEIPEMDMDKNAYGIEYAEIRPNQGSNLMVQFQIARRRLMTIRAEAKLTPKSHRPADYPEGRKLSCGCTVYNRSEIMSASLGSSCSDCYDSMS